MNKETASPVFAASGWFRVDQPPSYLRRTALRMLAGYPLAIPARGMAGASPAELRQAAALAGAEFTDAQGAIHRLSELARPLVLINLWAAWCIGCLIELPTIRGLGSQLGPEALDVVLLSHDMNWRADLAYVREAGSPFRHWRLSPQATANVVAAAFRIDADRFGLPQSVVFAGRKRTLVRSCQGSVEWTAPEQLRAARAWLEAAG